MSEGERGSNTDIIIRIFYFITQKIHSLAVIL